MIAQDQPTLFGAAVNAAVSSKTDGTMKFGTASDVEVVKNRRRFLERVGIDMNHTTLVAITYNIDNFAKYRIVTDDDKAIGLHDASGVIHADALVTTQPNHALFLPLADCVGVILYDPVRRVLMVSHIGRHSAEIDGTRRSVKYLEKECGCNASELKVWLSPAVGKASYPLHRFGGRGLHEVITDQLRMAGVKSENIEASPIDTATSADYYSYSEHLKGNGDAGRFAIVAEMRVQGEPAN